MKYPLIQPTSARVALLNGLALAALAAGAQTLPPPPVSPAPTVRLEYDAQGNPTRRVLAPGVANFSSSTAYDRLNRATVSTDARGKPTQLGYDGRENLLQVTDPRNLVTQYPRTGLGDATGLVSPDTGVATHTLDAAGNIKTRTDSRGVTASYSYDSLNRLTGVVYSQAGQTQSFVWNYDQTGPGFSNGIGRLTSTQFPGGSSSYAYDPQGRLTRTTQTVAAANTFTLGVGYGYDGAGNLTSITYPSGRVLYVPHAAGQPLSLSLAPSSSAAALPLMSGLQFEPGPGGPGALRSWNWELNAGPLLHSRAFDVHGRMVRYPLGGALRDISYDAADRISAFTHLDASTGQFTPATQVLNQAFGYDELGRLTSVTTPAGTWAYTYDDNGNRLSLAMTQGTQAVTQNHSVAATSNRLVAADNPARTFAHDTAGNTLTDQQAGLTRTVTYDLSGRLGRMTVTSASDSFDVNYVHDSGGLRLLKLVSQLTPPSTDPGSPFPLLTLCFTKPKFKVQNCPSYLQATAGATMYAYDQQGQLLGEYDGATGAVLREYVWLQNMPVAVVDGAPSSPQIYYVQTDHINTPRVLLDRSGRQRWSWVAEPFGNSAPVEDPIGQGTVKLNLRMPGQYFDGESGLAYNRHRTYDAGVGRYTQSDPIGLDGGINTYAYVGGNPVSRVDPYGLWSTSGHNEILFAFAAKTGLTVGQLQAMMAGSAAADAGKYQDDKHSFMHAMSSSKLTKKQACELARDFVRDKINRATEDMGRFPGLTDPYWQLGFGLHAVMDSTSPAHRGFAFWTNWVFPIHGPFWTSIEDKPSPAQIAATVKRMIDAMNGRFDFDCECY